MDWNNMDDMDYAEEEEAIMNEYRNFEAEQQMIPDDFDEEPSTTKNNNISSTTTTTRSSFLSDPNAPTPSFSSSSHSHGLAHNASVEKDHETVDPWIVTNNNNEDDIRALSSLQTTTTTRDTYNRSQHTTKKSFAFMALHSSLDFATKIAEQIHYCDNAVDFLHAVPPSVGEYMSCTLTDGTKHFLTKRAPVEVVDTHSLHGKPGQLLQLSMSALTEKALELEVQSKLQKTRASELKVSELVETDLLLYENLALEKSLWVEKYKPRGFSQLLSPENINREVLRALKQWDRFVFKRANPKAPEKPLYNSTSSGYSKQQQQQQQQTNPSANAATQKPKESKKRRGGDQNGAEDDSDDDEDDDHDAVDDEDNGRIRDVRPEAKVLLLSGPPGTGKTTLAHILATHCGYRPFEINASDDRTLDVLREKIVSAMTANTVTGDKRPNCIILDEADGIDSTATIDMIVNMIKAPLRGSDAKSALNAIGKKSKKGAAVTSTGTPLTRPIICICNDHFAPVLKSLKKVAQIFVFQPPSELRLAQVYIHK